jgi:hypothetical protein
MIARRVKHRPQVIGRRLRAHPKVLSDLFHGTLFKVEKSPSNNLGNHAAAFAMSVRDSNPDSPGHKSQINEHNFAPASVSSFCRSPPQRVVVAQNNSRMCAEDRSDILTDFSGSSSFAFKAAVQRVVVEICYGFWRVTYPGNGMNVVGVKLLHSKKKRPGFLKPSRSKQHNGKNEAVINQSSLSLGCQRASVLVHERAQRRSVFTTTQPELNLANG